MKIDPSHLAQTGLEPERAATSRPRQPDEKTGPTPAVTDVELKRSPVLRDIEQTLATQEVDRARVEAIKAALARGDYVISPERIASGLIHTALQTLAEGE